MFSKIRQGIGSAIQTIKSTVSTVTSIVTGNYDDFGQFDHLFEEKVEEVESVAPEEKVEVEGKKEPEIILSPEEEERIRLDTDKRAKERAAQIITKYRELYLLDSDGKKMWDSKYVDPRTTNTFAIERNFRYIYDHGELRLSFVTPTSKNTKIRGIVFRKVMFNDIKTGELKDLKFLADRSGLDDVDNEQLRMIISDEYRLAKQSAEEELLDIQKKTAGVGIYRAVKEFVQHSVPAGYSVYVNNVNYDSPETADNVDDFPYNYGVLLTKDEEFLPSSPTVAPIVKWSKEVRGTKEVVLPPYVTDKITYFYCCASDKCRRKGFNIKLPLALSKERRDEVVIRHLKEEHWSALIQVNDYK